MLAYESSLKECGLLSALCLVDDERMRLVGDFC